MTSRRPTSHITSAPHSLPSDTSHLQTGPRVGNQFLEDAFMRATLARLSPSSPSWFPEISHMAERAMREMRPRARVLDFPENAPKLKAYDAWGKRSDEISMHPNWRFMHRVAAEEGVVAVAYDYPEFKEDARLVQMIKVFYYAPASALYSCPLAMTDGATRYLMLALGKHVPVVDLQAREENMLVLDDSTDVLRRTRGEMERVLGHLRSRDPMEMYTSGQWMTERGGGSDVAQGTETIARLQPDGSYKLFGYKWFTSATDADVALTLARIEDEGSVAVGTKGLSCFMLRIRDPTTKTLNNIKVHRLKDKLGTKQVPTAEMELLGTSALLVSIKGRGVPAITTGMVNITRVHNAVSACASMRIVAALGRDYSHRRVVFGRTLAETPLHLRTMAVLELNYRACVSLTLDAVSIMSRLEAVTDVNAMDSPLGGSGVIGSELDLRSASALVRLLTPLLKAFTAKIAVQCASEGLELFGGVGYMEDSGLPVILRDAQVLPIWEGTTNVQSHDLLRVLSKSKFESFLVFAKVCKARSKMAMNSGSVALNGAAQAVSKAVDLVEQYLKSNFVKEDLHAFEANARELLMSLSRTYAGSCLIEHAVWSNDQKDALVAKRWCCDSGDLISFDNAASTIEQKNELVLDRSLALDFESLAEGKPRGCGDYDENKKLRAFF